MPQFEHFPLPDVGEGLTEAEIVAWRVRPGETVSVNQVIVEIETAKAAVELPCPYAGTISELLVEPGRTVQVGTPIISIDRDPDGAAPSPAQGGPAQGGPAQGSSEPTSAGSSDEVANLVGYGPHESAVRRRPRKSSARTPSGTPTAAPVGAAVGTPAGTSVEKPANGTSQTNGTPAGPGVIGTNGSNGTRHADVPLAKPPVRKLAKDLGVDLHEVAGSGTEGVITRTDVERAATPPPTGVPAADSTSADRSAREHRVPVKGVRKATAQAMVDSAFTAPHVTEFLTVDVTPMMEFRQRLRSQPEFRDVKVTPLAVAAKAVCLAARRTPDVNAAWDGEAGEIVYKDYVHLGIAAATPRGLVVPKVRDADARSLRDLSVSIQQLTDTAREGRTAPGDLTGGTFTITNVGVFGIDTGTPILNPGESGILALGAVREMPWVVDGQVVPRQVCTLALSFDHRVVDGQQGSQFLADVGALLADPGMAMTY